MKIFSYIVFVIAVALIIFNLTKVNFSQPFEGESSIALIGVVAGLCAIILVLIFKASKAIEEKTK